MEYAQVDAKVEQALRIQNKLGFYGPIAPIFGNTCNNNQEVENYINYQDKHILLPASSGDSWLSAVYNGCEDGVLYDVNCLTQFYTYLRIGAVRYFENKKDMLSFMVPGLKDSCYLNPKIAGKIQLPEEAQYFWHQYLSKASREQIATLISFSHCRGYDLLPYIQSGMPFYQNQKAYEKLRQKLLEKEYPPFIQSDIRELHNHLSTSFDVIDLSNIIECLVLEELYQMGYSTADYIEQNKIEKKWIAFIESSIDPYLRFGGRMLLNYRENVDVSEGDLNDPLFAYQTHVIPSKNTYAYDTKDAISIYTKEEPKFRIMSLSKQNYGG